MKILAWLGWFCLWPACVLLGVVVFIVALFLAVMVWPIVPCFLPGVSAGPFCVAEEEIKDPTFSVV